MKKNKVLTILVIVFFVIFLFVCGVAIYEEMKIEEQLISDKNNNNNNDPSLVDKNLSNKIDLDTVIFDVTDKEVIDLIEVFDIAPLLDDEDIISLIYSGEDAIKVNDFNDKQKMYLALSYYIVKNDIKYGLCELDNDIIINKNDLKGVLFEDSSYLNSINNLKEEKSGLYSYAINGNDISLCGNVIGFEGPIRNTNDLVVVSAFKLNDKFYLNTKFAYYKYISTGEDGLLHYDAYDVYKNGNIPVDSFVESYAGEYDIDYSQFATYEYVFKIKKDKFYLESINRK